MVNGLRPLAHPVGVIALAVVAGVVVVMLVWLAGCRYAIVFGATKKWAQAFEGLGAEQQGGGGSW